MKIQTQSGTTTVTLERNETIVVVKDVPAEICENCSEYYLGEEVTEKIQSLAEQATRQGVGIEVLQYAA